MFTSFGLLPYLGGARASNLSLLTDLVKTKNHAWVPHITHKPKWKCISGSHEKYCLNSAGSKEGSMKRKLDASYHSLFSKGTFQHSYLALTVEHVQIPTIFCMTG